MRSLAPIAVAIAILMASPPLADARSHAHGAVSHGEQSGVGLVIAGLIPILGLALVAGVVYYAIRRAREAR